MLGSVRGRVALGAIVLVLLLAIGGYLFINRQQPAGASASSATLTIYAGTAQVEHSGSTTFSNANSGTSLRGGDTVQTGAATKAAIDFPDGSVTRLDSNTSLTVKTVDKSGPTYTTVLDQTAGKTWNKVTRLVGLSSFNVKGPNNATAEVRGTTFTLIIDPNGDVRVDDYAGTVILHASKGSVTISVGQSSSVKPGATSPTGLTGIPPGDLTDPFTVFNVAADANLDATGGGKILSVSANNAIAVGDTAGAFTGGTADGNSDLSFTLDWPGSTFELVILDPDGIEFDTMSSDQHPFTYTVPKARSGAWGYKVHDIKSDRPNEQWSVVVGAVSPAKQAPQVFFRGGPKQTCDHTVGGGNTDTWAVRARDAAGIPVLSISSVPGYVTFTDDGRGTGTFKFDPPADVPAADLAITLTASVGTAKLTLSCTEHVIPPRDSSEGGSVVSGGSGVAGVAVTLTSPDGGSQSVLTDSAGNFNFGGLGAGAFTLAVTVPSGYKAGGATRQAVTLDGTSPGASVTFTLVPFTISPATLPNGSVGDPSCSVLSLLNGVAPITWAVSGGVLPPGTGFDGYGHCTGTPTTAGTYNFTLSATDANGDTASQSYTVTIFSGPVITGPGPATGPIRLRQWDMGFANPQTLTAGGGIAPYSWSLVSGSLPSGLTVGAATGTLTGAPTREGTFSAIVQVTDSVGANAYRTVILSVVRPPQIGRATFKNGAVGLGYNSSQYGLGGGVPPYSLSATGLPPGLAAGLSECEGLCLEVRGTPTQAGTFPSTITFSDSVGGSATWAGSFRIAAAPLAIVPAALPRGGMGVGYSVTLTSTGGMLPPETHSWYYSFGLPAGLSFNNATQVISGTPRECGHFKPLFLVSDSSGSVSALLPLDIGARTPTICSPLSGPLPSSDVGAGAYSVPLVAAGGTGPYNWSVATGVMPPSLLIANNGTANASLSAADFSAGDIGSWTFTLVATDGTDTTSAGANYQLQIWNRPSGSAIALAVAQTGAFYTQGSVFTWTSGNPNGCASGTAVPPLPPGLYLVNLGCNQSQLRGIPTSSVGSPFTFTLTPVDSPSYGSSTTGAPVTYQLSVVDSLLSLTVSGRPTSAVGVAYSANVSATGGSQPYAYSVAGGSLPSGLTLDGVTGRISGTATTSGTFSASIRVVDASNTVASSAFALTVDPALTLAPDVLPGGDQGRAYAQQLTASGGSGGIIYSFTCGAFSCGPPAGLSIDPSTGLLTAANPVSTLAQFAIAVTDSDGNTARRDYSITFAPAPVILTGLLPNTARLSGYCQSLAAAGGTPGYTWAVTGGAVPNGLTLDSWGHLTGTPTVAGAYTFTVAATDSAGALATQSYTITIS